MKKTLLTLAVFLLLISCHSSENTKSTFSTLSGPVGKKVMISSAHPIATKIGVNILKKGGNAYDAAVGVHFALAVVFPRAGNIGGGGFAVIRTKDGKINSLDFREKAPLKASKNMYLDENQSVIEGLSRGGVLAVGVPGSVNGMITMHKKYGFLPFEELIQPAIDVASEGYVLTEFATTQLNRFQEVFEKYNGEDFFLLKKEGWRKGEIIKNPDLARTLTKIQKEGTKGFYEGEVANLLLKTMKKYQGIITKEDLTKYKSVWRKPVEGQYRKYKIISMPPPSSGGIALIQLLQGAEKYDIKKMGHNTVKNIHLQTELERRVYADRATYLGDPDFYEVPQNMLLSPSYNQKRFGDISLDKKTSSQDIKEGDVRIIESVETTHFSIVDSERNAIAVTTTLNGFFGSKVLVEGAGFFLNNEMDDFSAKPGVPNMFGLVGGEANAIQPEKRMLSSMTPTIIEKDNKLKMVVGTPGGSTIITCNFQTIMNIIDHGMTMQEAVNAKKTHSQWLPDKIIIEENATSQEVINGLKALGHQIEYRDKLGRMDCILVREDGTLEGGSDNTRDDNYSEGY